MITLNKEILYDIRKQFKNIFPLKIKSSYLSEAVSSGYGFKSSISLLTYIETNLIDINSFSIEKFSKKIKFLYKTDNTDFIKLCEECILKSINMKIRIRRIPLLKDLLIESNLEKQLFSYNKDNGMILIAGPTGSGKTTLLSSILQNTLDNNKKRMKLSVYEDVEEFEYNANKANIDYNIIDDITYGNLKNNISHFKKRENQVFCIGEMRTKEFILSSCELSKNNLIFSTLHANNILSVIRCLIHCCENETSDKIISYLLNINTLIYQELIKTQNNKRTPLREYLVFNDQLRLLIVRTYEKNKLISDVEDLLVSIMSDKTNIKGLIFKSRITSALELYKQGKIDINELNKIKDIFSL
jgi:Tfp pilus assembly pilus retraction ATPase PilT